MDNWKDKVKQGLLFVPAGMLIGCAAVSLNRYNPPKFEVEAAQEHTEKKQQTEPEIDDGEIPLPPAGKGSAAKNAPVSVAKVKEDAQYKDGTYYGVGTGFGGPLKVKLVIKEGKIASITVVESKDDAAYLNRASALLDTIVKTQSTNVDTVSGATYSSAGLIQAVRAALKEAEVVQEQQKTTRQKKKQNVAEGTVPYLDGVYYGTGKGFNGDVEVAVVIKDKTIQDIVVTKSEDDEAFFSKAKRLLDTIVEKQSTQVDVVSGATFSSNGLIEAVNNALAQAKRITEGNTTQAEQTESAVNQSDNATNQSDNTTNQQYTDGIYYGTGRGFKGDVEVAVTIEQHAIREIRVTKSEDDESFFKRASVLLDTIVKKQSADVDTISGATFSSNGIIDAVKNALEKAEQAGSTSEQHTRPDTEKETAEASTEKITEVTTQKETQITTAKPQKETTTQQETGAQGETTAAQRETSEKQNDRTTQAKTEQPVTQNTATQTQEKTTQASIVYQDGTYKVTVTCNPDDDWDFEPYTLAATVTIADGKVVSITDVCDDEDADSDNAWYISRAAKGTAKYKGVVSQIQEKGNADKIDAVSGATCSSNAIIKAVRDALENAKVKGR